MDEPLPALALTGKPCGSSGNGGDFVEVGEKGQQGRGEKGDRRWATGNG